MARTKISEFSETPGNNTDIDSINIAEGCAPSGINDAIRELMAQLKDFQTGAVGDSFNGPVGTTTAAAGAFTTLAASGAVTLSGGTANGVAYLNGSKVLTSGSALVFDGTNLGIGTSSPVYKLTVKSASDQIHITTPTAGDGAGDGFTLGMTGTTAQFIQRENAPIIFYTNSTDRLTLDSSGNLGLGVTPSAWSGYKVMQAGIASFAGGSSGAYLLSDNAYTDNSGAGWKYINSSYAAAQYYAASGAHVWRTAPSGTAGNAISFTQAMTLDASGNLLVGTTSALGRLTVLQGATSNTDTIALLAATASGAGSQPGLKFYNSSSVAKAYIFWDTNADRTYVQTGASGGVYLANAGTAWTSASDERVKDIIEPIINAVNKVSSLRAVIGKYKTDEEGTRRSFLIAQDVQAVLPEAVDASDPEKLGVQYTEVIPLLVAAIKEQQALIQSLQADVAALKAAA